MYSESRNNPAFWDKKKLKAEFQGPPIHTHNAHELYFLISGSTTYFVCDEVITLQAGDMLFVPQNSLHRTEYNDNKDVERVVFSFNDDFLSEDLLHYVDEMAANKHIVFDSHGLRKITSVVNKIESEILERKPGNKIMQQLYFQQLLILISRYRCTSSITKSSSPLHVRVNNIAEYIHKNYAADISLISLSEFFSLSPSHLSKSFKAVTGTGIKEYINVSRIEAAKELLLTTELSVTEIATQCGFYDSNYFASAFKKIVGVTPKKYSMLNRDKES